MKAIIDGKRFDTEKATYVAEYWNGCGRGDFHWVAEELFVTARGAWFLAGEGGALTKYARPMGNNGVCGGARIFPLAPGEAQEWLESHGKTAALEKHFSASIEEAL